MIGGGCYEREGLTLRGRQSLAEKGRAFCSFAYEEL